MARSKELRFQPSNPGTPTDTGVARYFAGSSGELRFVTDAGTVYNSAAFYTITNSNSVVTLTSGTLRAGNDASLSSGYYYGTTGTRIITTALGEPNTWLSINVSGITYSVPAYTRT